MVDDHVTPDFFDPEYPVHEVGDLAFMDVETEPAGRLMYDARFAE